MTLIVPKNLTGLSNMVKIKSFVSFLYVKDKKINTKI